MRRASRAAGHESTQTIRETCDLGSSPASIDSVDKSGRKRVARTDGIGYLHWNSWTFHILIVDQEGAAFGAKR